MSNKETIYGFGVNPSLTTNHFYIIIPSKNNEMVQYTKGLAGQMQKSRLLENQMF